MFIGRLLDLVNRYYELQLCYIELTSLGARKIKHDLENNSFIFDFDGDLESLLFRSSWFSFIDGRETFISQIINACREIVWKYNDLWFCHISYPFKARMRPQVARSLINIVCPQDIGTILDPFCGSGTTNIEAYLCGLNSVGVDIIPFYVFMSEAKIRFFKEKLEINHPLMRVINAACSLLKTKLNFSQKVSEIKILQDIFFEGFKDKIPFSSHEFKVGTASKIPYPDNFFSAIVCSPPFGSAIDYRKENPGPPELMDPPSHLQEYLLVTKDEQNWKRIMDLAFIEMYRVVKPFGRLAIIVGNQKRKGQIIDLINWTVGGLKAKGFDLLYRFPELISSTGTRNILFDEILIFEKR